MDYVKATAEERWIAHHCVESIRAEYRATGTDTAETYVHLRARDGDTAVWKDTTFARVADLKIWCGSVAEAKREVRLRVEESEKFEKAHARELADYARLKAKFEGSGI